MVKKVLFFVFVIGMLAGVTLAQNVVFVSFHGADDAPHEGAVGAGFTEAPDKGYTDMLTDAGYSVTRYVTTSSPDPNVLNAADLVIISRSISSGDYSGDGATAWNSITAPMIVMSGYTLRTSRMGYTTGTTMVDTTGDISLAASNPNHPIFAGISMTDGTMDNPYAGIVTYPTDGVTVARGISVNNDPANEDGTVLATVATADDPTVGGMIIGEWLAGSTMNHSGGAGTDILAGRRLVFLTGSREADGVDSRTAGIMDLYEDGQQMLLNAVAYMLAEPPVKGLTHSYTFEDGTARDVIGGADGTLVGGAEVIDGKMVTTAQDQWMEMPGDVIAVNTYDAVTVEAWYTPTAGANTSWSMLAYFGDSVDGLGSNGFFITSARGDDKSRAAISIGDIATPWASESGADGPELDDGLDHYMASTIDATQITLYIDGELIAATELSETNRLSGVSTNYAYLAKGGYDGDPEWIGAIDEFNMYNVALTEDEIELNYLIGPKGNKTHSYTFEDGTANDNVGNADGELVGGAAVVGGAMVTTAQDQWMSMPGDEIAVNTYSAVTVEAFYTPTAGANTSWSMLAYFGDSVNGLGSNGFFITSARGDDKSRAAISVGDIATPWASESGADGPEYDDGLPHQMASTIDDTQITLYIDGELIAATELSETNKLSGVSNNYAMLAKGGYDGDPEWIGEIEEFNMYSVALTADEIAASYAAGPVKLGPQPIDPGTEGLVAYYPLDSAGRGVTKDASGNGNDGAIVGDPVFVADAIVGNALEFSGDDYVDCGTTEDLANWTISAWVRSPMAPVSDAGQSGPIHREANYQMNWNHGGAGWAGAVGLSAGGWYAASLGPLEADTWYHLAGTYDGETLKAYTDGVLITANEDPSGPAGAEANSLKLGKHARDAYFFTGTIDEVLVYRRALSDLEVAYLAGL